MSGTYVWFGVWLGAGVATDEAAGGGMSTCMPNARAGAPLRAWNTAMDKSSRRVTSGVS